MENLASLLVKAMIGAVSDVSETTSFVYDDNKLVPVQAEDEKEIERRNFSKRKLAEDEYWMLIPQAIQEREFPIFQTLHAYILDKMRQYLLLKAEDAKGTTSYSKETLYKDLAKDIMTSQVLERLISGKDLLPTPPPKSYFHNWYDLVDDGEAVCIDVTFTTITKWNNGSDIKEDIVRIDGEEWKMLEKLTEDNDSPEYIVQWKDTEYVYKLSRMQAEDYERLVHPYQRKLVTKDHYSWKLTRFTRGESNE